MAIGTSDGALVKPIYWLAVSFLALVFFALGCGGGSSSPSLTPTTPTPTPTPTGDSISGGVHSGVNGGEMPIVGATVTVYAAGTTGYGSAPSALGSTTTDKDGNYNISPFTCPSPNAQIYVVAAGGGVNGGAANPAITFMTAVGACGQLTFTGGVFPVDLDELTTVASTYALSYFINASDPAQVGTVTANASGLANAASLIPNLANFSDGTLAKVITSGNNAPNTLDSLANILAACVTSSGASSTSCTTLFSNVTPPPSAPAATNTLMAVLDIARTPASNPGALFALQAASPPYTPALDANPFSGWVLGLNYSGVGVGLNNPLGIAIDGNGNVWVANFNGNSVSAITPAGNQVKNFPVTDNISEPDQIAIDSNGNAWVTNQNNNTVAELNPTGGTAGGPFSGNGLDSPAGIAIDTSGNVWVGNGAASALSVFNSRGVAISGSPFTGGGISNNAGVAIDAQGNVWTSNSGNDTVSEFNSVGSPISGSLGYFGGGLISPRDIAIDSHGNAWINNTGSKGIGGISEFNPAGSALSPAISGFTGGGQNGTGIGIAIDSQGNAWSTNAFSISETSSAGLPLSPPAGFGATGVGLSNAQGIAIDASGNVWAANQTNNSVTVLLGAASPVLTPLVACQLRAPFTPACLP